MIGIVSLEDDVDSWAVPLIEEITKHEPGINVELEVAFPGEGSYAASINKLGQTWRSRYPDDPWFIPMNADVSCRGPFQQYLDQMPLEKLYGMTINTKGEVSWIDGWIYVISQQIWDTVGEFDEKFRIACFEDADYTFRALEKGVGIAKVNLPFVHFRASPRMRVPNFWKIRKENQAYLASKWDLGPEWSYR